MRTYAHWLRAFSSTPDSNDRSAPAAAAGSDPSATPPVATPPVVVAFSMSGDERCSVIADAWVEEAVRMSAIRLKMMIMTAVTISHAMTG